MKFPNAWTKFFVLICSAFRRFLLGIEYFLTLLNPLFPRVPVLTVVKYGVKNASWPGAAGVCQPRLGSVFSWEKLLGFQQLLDGIHGRPLIPDLRIVIRLSAAHPAGAVDLSLGQPSGGAVFPRKDILFSSKLAEDRFLAMNRTHALFAIVTAVSVQLCSLLDSSGRLQESSRKHALLQAAYLPRRKTVITHYFNPFCCLGYCTSVKGVKQVFSVRRAYQFFTRLFKE